MHAGNQVPLKILLPATCVLQTMENFAGKVQRHLPPLSSLCIQTKFIPRRDGTIPSAKPWTRNRKTNGAATFYPIKNNYRTSESRARQVVARLFCARNFTRYLTQDCKQIFKGRKEINANTRFDGNEKQERVNCKRI